MPILAHATFGADIGRVVGSIAGIAADAPLSPPLDQTKRIILAACATAASAVVANLMAVVAIAGDARQMAEMTLEDFTAR